MMIGDRDKRDEQRYYQRERIATTAMAALISRSKSGVYEDIAKSAIKYANALIKELHSGD